MMGGIAFPQHGVIAACTGTWGDVDAGIPYTLGGGLVRHGLTCSADHTSAEVDRPIEPIFEIAQHADHPAELDPIVISIAVAIHVGHHVQHGTHFLVKGRGHETGLPEVVGQQATGSRQ